MKKRILMLLLCALLVASTVLTPISALASSNAKILIVNVDGARLRSGPNRNRIVTSLKRGTRVVYAGKHEGSMYYVKAENGKKGYIYMRYLSAYGAAPANKIYGVKAKATLYRRASTSSRRVMRLAKGTTVICYETKGKWAYVRTLNGKAGYIKKSYLKR